MNFIWGMLIAILKLFLNVVLFCVTPFIAVALVLFVYYFIKGKRFKKGEFKNIGYGSFIRRIFYLFPQRLILDMFERDPDHFTQYGVHIIAGEQGKGKTITVVYLLQRFKKMYPKLKIKTNMSYLYEDAPINHWKDVVSSSNGIYGEIDVIDEIQNWFNSMQSKDFPVEMLTEITQQRKQTKMIIGTTQVFSRAAKPIREQTTYLYKPCTLFGCVTVVGRFKPVFDDHGTLTKSQLRGVFFFVHNDEIRNSFDTYKKIQRYSEEGFKSENLHISDNSTVINMTANVKAKRK